MLYIFFGASCTGKSTVAESVQEIMDVEILTGKDYLRLDKNEQNAFLRLITIFEEVALSKDKHMIYIVTDQSLYERIQIENAYKVLFTASLDEIKNRFMLRMKTEQLPKPLESMLEEQYNAFKDEPAQVTLDTTNLAEEEILQMIINLIKNSTSAE